MPANTTLSLVIDQRATGTSEVQKAEAALNAFTSAGGRAAKSAGEHAAAFGATSAQIAGHALTVKHATEILGAAFASVSGSVLALGGTVAAHATTMEGLTNTYRAARLAISPTMFTGVTLAIGVLTEATVKATLAQDKLIERQAVLAVKNKLDYGTQQSLTVLGSRQNFDFTAAFNASGAGSLEDFGAIIKQLGAIKDPADRARETMKQFGNEIGESILPQLGDRFAENERRIREWGIGISSVDRENIGTFTADMRSLKEFFTETSDSISLSATKIKQAWINMFAAGYAGAREFAVTTRHAIEAHPFSQAGDLPDNGMALFVDSLDLSKVRRTLQEHTTSMMTDPLRRNPGSWDPGFVGPVAGISAAARTYNDAGARDREKVKLDEQFDALRALLFENKGKQALTDLKLVPGKDDKLIAAAAKVPLDNLRGTVEDAFVSVAARRDAINAEIKAEEEAKKTAEQAAATFKAIQAQVLGLQREAILSGKTGVEAASLRRGFTLDDMRAQGASKAQLSAADRALTQPLALEAALQGIQETASKRHIEEVLSGEERNRLALTWGRYSLEKTGYSDPRDLIRHSLEEYKTEQETQRTIRGIGLGADREDILRQASKTLRLSELGAGSGANEQQDAANDAYRIRIGLAEKLRNLDLVAAAKELDLNKQAIDMAKAEADYKKQAQDAELERTLRLAEIQKKRVDEFRSFATDFVNAAQSRSLPAFFKQQGQKIENQVIGNAAELAFKYVPSLSLTNDPNSLIGKLLAGTPFGAKAISPEVTALDKNRVALEDLTAVLRGDPALSALGPAWSTIPGLGAGGGISSIARGLGAVGGLNLSTLLGAPGGTSGFAGKLGAIFNGGSGTVQGMPGGWTPPSVFGSDSTTASVAHSTAFGTLLDSSASTSSRVGAGATTAAAAYGAYLGIKEVTKGGAKNVIDGVGDTAMAVAPFTGPAAPFVEVAGMALKLISSFIGDPKAIRQRDINRRLAADQFYTPVAINASMSTGGSGVGYNRYGQLSVLDRSPYPRIEEPYADLRHGITVPGRTLDYGGGPSGVNRGPTVVYAPQILAMDGTDVQRVLDKHAAVFADSLGATLLNGHGANLISAFRQVQ